MTIFSSLKSAKSRKNEALTWSWRLPTAWYLTAAKKSPEGTSNFSSAAILKWLFSCSRNHLRGSKSKSESWNRANVFSDYFLFVLFCFLAADSGCWAKKWTGILSQALSLLFLLTDRSYLVMKIEIAIIFSKNSIEKFNKIRDFSNFIFRFSRICKV